MTNDPPSENQDISEISRELSSNAQELLATLNSLSLEFRNSEVNSFSAETEAIARSTLSASKSLSELTLESEIDESTLANFLNYGNLLKELENTDIALEQLESKFDILNGKLDEILADFDDNTKTDGIEVKTNDTDNTDRSGNDVKVPADDSQSI
ncbi:hypothetical protein BKA69DRAFT_1121461 [Paraphysoderma sedebokerense]|nr:hypothetical protein BKA69DRAFT_1121461 [Paraphysoderma sedebokerense]